MHGEETLHHSSSKSLKLLISVVFYSAEGMKRCKLCNKTATVASFEIMAGIYTFPITLKDKKNVKTNKMGRFSMHG
jgi:hypothetical protein